MTLAAEIVNRVRARANYACEYCGVSEIGCGGALTVDHYHPSSQGGSDDPENLLYCCFRCNVFKRDYWPNQPNDAPVWNPRTESRDIHLRELPDGTLQPLTIVGASTIKVLRLNRPQLVAHRLRRSRKEERRMIVALVRERLMLLESSERNKELEMGQQQSLLKQQRLLYELLLAEDTEEDD